MLRRRGFGGSIVMLSQDTAPPVDRPNLSKDYLAGSAPEDWLPLRPDDFYAENGIELRLNAEVAGIDTQGPRTHVAGGENLPYDRLLLATGAEPVRLPIPGADQPHVHTLRSLADCRAIIETAKNARRARRHRRELHRAGGRGGACARATSRFMWWRRKQRPMERVLGPQMGDFVRALHEEHGVVFHLEDTVTAIDGRRATLKSGGTLEADLVVVGVGVRPRLALAEQAGLAIDRGVRVDAYLETSARGVYAAGDIARWPDPHSGDNIRVEHWVVAERQGQTAACNMLGLNERFDAVPFFWSQHYDVPINYVGHAEHWDEYRGRWRYQIEGLPAAIQEERAGACRRLDIPRCRQSQGRIGDGAARRQIAFLGGHPARDPSKRGHKRGQPSGGLTVTLLALSGRSLRQYRSI